MATIGDPIEYVAALLALAELLRREPPPGSPDAAKIERCREHIAEYEREHRVEVSTVAIVLDADAEGYRVACRICGRAGKMAAPLPDKMHVTCPQCADPGRWN